MTATVLGRLAHEAELDRRLRAEMYVEALQEEASIEHIRSAAMRVFRWANVFGAIVLPIICAAGVALIHLRWPL